VDNDFVIGLLGALAPESWRLYNLRNQPQLPWSWRYVVFTLPFLLVGGAIAYVLEPSTKWGAFYAGLTAPILLTTVMKDTAKAQQEYETLALALAAEKQRQAQLAAENQALLQRLTVMNSDQLRGALPPPPEALPSPPPTQMAPAPLAIPDQPPLEIPPSRGQLPWLGLLLGGGLLAAGLAIGLSQPFWLRPDSDASNLPGDADILLSYQPRLVGLALLLLGLGLGGLGYYRHRQRRRAGGRSRWSVLDQFLGGLP